MTRLHITITDLARAFASLPDPALFADGAVHMVPVGENRALAFRLVSGRWTLAGERITIIGE